MPSGSATYSKCHRVSNKMAQQTLDLHGFSQRHDGILNAVVGNVTDFGCPSLRLTSTKATEETCHICCSSLTWYSRLNLSPLDLAGISVWQQAHRKHD